MALTRKNLKIESHKHVLLLLQELHSTDARKIASLVPHLLAQITKKLPIIHDGISNVLRLVTSCL